ncbi:MAG: OmpA family protein [Geminicoccaceae bacterium]|nr:OmpA family protein [Geminicoccaceae bacterium]
MSLHPTIAVLLASISLAACQTGSDGRPTVERGTGTGAAAGAVVGGVLGAVLDKNDVRGVALGGALGGAAGAAIGSIFDRQQRELEETLEAEQAANQVEIERVRDDLLKISLANEVSFDLDSAAIKPAFAPTLEKLADVLGKYDRTRATIVGHTDSTGSDAYNQALSERRAAAVRDELVRYGIDPYRLITEGRGEREPRVDNDSAAGRQLNRRVEILVAPERA